MGSHVAPSGGSASDDWATQGRTRGKARGARPSRTTFAPSAPPRMSWAQTWPLHDIAMVNIVWYGMQ